MTDFDLIKFSIPSYHIFLDSIPHLNRFPSGDRYVAVCHTDGRDVLGDHEDLAGRLFSHKDCC